LSVAPSPPARAGYLLDTSVLSMTVPDKNTHMPPTLSAWLLQNSRRLFIPCIAIAEVEQGICKLRRAGGTERAERLARWLDGLIEGYAERILPLDAQASRIAGQMADQATAEGCHPGFADVAIAALARRSDLLVLTRNLKHFAALHVACADPLTGLPE
jgi:toxin FitB